MKSLVPGGVGDLAIDLTSQLAIDIFADHVSHIITPCSIDKKPVSPLIADTGREDMQFLDVVNQERMM